MSDAPAPSDPLIELAVKVAVLQHRVDAQGLVLDALALCVPISRRSELLQLFTALQLNAAARGERDAALAMVHFVQRFVALTDPALSATVAQARQLLVQQGLLFAATPAHLQSALETWLAQATPDEIAQELAELPAPRRGGAAAAKPKRERKPPRRKAGGGGTS